MPALSKRHWTFDSELIAYGTRGRHYFAFPEEGHCPSTWEFPREPCDLHPTKKPIPVLEHALLHSSRPGAVVLDPYAGSGSTAVACARHGRLSRLVEIDPRMCETALQRLEAELEEPARRTA